MNESKPGKSNTKKGKTKVRENDEAVVRSGGGFFEKNPHPTQRSLKRLSVLSLSLLLLGGTSYLSTSIVEKTQD